MTFQKTVIAAVSVLCLTTTSVFALSPLTKNARIMGELVDGEVSYQIHKHCPSIKMRKLRALNKLNALADHARGLGYSDADFKSLSKDSGAKGLRDARVNAYLKQNGVTNGDADSYCRLGYQEIEKKSLIGYLLRGK